MKRSILVGGIAAIVAGVALVGTNTTGGLAAGLICVSGGGLVLRRGRNRNPSPNRLRAALSESILVGPYAARWFDHADKTRSTEAARHQIGVKAVAAALLVWSLVVPYLAATGFRSSFGYNEAVPLSAGFALRVAAIWAIAVVGVVVARRLRSAAPVPSLFQRVAVRGLAAAALGLAAVGLLAASTAAARHIKTPGAKPAAHQWVINLLTGTETPATSRLAAAPKATFDDLIGPGPVAAKRHSELEALLSHDLIVLSSTSTQVVVFDRDEQRAALFHPALLAL